MLDKAKHLDFDLWSLDVDVAAINVNEVLMASCKNLDLMDITDKEDRLRLLPALIQANYQHRILEALQEIETALTKPE